MTAPSDHGPRPGDTGVAAARAPRHASPLSPTGRGAGHRAASHADPADVIDG